MTDQLAPDILRLRAPNPSPMTFTGTNTYLLGTRRLIVMDPGPDHAGHRAAILAAAAGRPIDAILVTHTHLDHSPGARPLAAETGAEVLAFGTMDAGKSQVMQDLSRAGTLGGGEGRDEAFTPDRTLSDGETLTHEGQTLTALHTPGHLGNHLCFLRGDTAFSGDHIMGWATSLVSPPDGDLTDFMASCRKLAATGVTRLLPGHGEPVEDAQSRIAEIIAHRQGREAQITEALAKGPATATTLTAAIYTDVAPALLPMAERNVLAHLIDLYRRGIVRPEGALSASAPFRLA